MTKPTPDSHSCPELTGVGAAGRRGSISLPNPQLCVTSLTPASCRVLLPWPPSSCSRERVCNQVSSVPRRARRKPLWSEGWCGVEGEGEVLIGSTHGPQGPQNLVFTCPPGSLGIGASPPPPDLDLCHSHPYGSHGGGVKVGEIPEVESRGWALAQAPWIRANPTAAPKGMSRENAPSVPGG